ncbi:MAG: asparagine synthase-related protein [Cyanobacteria bacterium]|nr:asparagine synthase-related protein [Cyanobacteriota bacterium]MDW8201123.1 asparagine synthase-related protein [Cyanobacteriota bacterium SKYGB_h_bin112]
MSGIVGIVHFNQTAVDRDLLSRMTKFLSYQGPDGCYIWSEGNVGMGYALLCTTANSSGGHQPYSLSKTVWAVADIRLDARDDLARSLEAKGCPISANASDIELLLWAYQVWGQTCVQHLQGDFAFAIWDASRQQLFCGRDHFGIKLFYYTRVGDRLIFSNNLNCLRQHPLVSSTLNDVAIVDFLLFEVNYNPETTVFADIKRLPPAHTLVCSDGNQVQSSYWVLPTDGCIRYSHEHDYVEHFRWLMQQAIAERLTTNRVGILMSGGLDSTAIAAIARQLSRSASQSIDLQAYTIVCETIMPDQEKTYAELAAQYLGIPIHYLVGDSYTLMQGWDHPKSRRPEPSAQVFPSLLNDVLSRAVSHSPVLLAGYGGDPVLLPSSAYALRLLRAGKLGSLIAGIWQYWCWNRRLPPIGIRTQVKKLLSRPPRSQSWTCPRWLNPTLVTRLNLAERYQSLSLAHQKDLVHPTRQEAYRNLRSPTLTSIFETYDPGITGYPVEVRYPYLDLRLVNYLLAIPPLPWFVHKQLLRRAMVGLLPDPVRLRPKAPLAGDPVAVLWQHPSSQWLDQIGYHTRMSDYVDVDFIASFGANCESSRIKLRLFSLSQWFSYANLSNS